MGERKKDIYSLIKCIRKSYLCLYRCFFLLFLNKAIAKLNQLVELRYGCKGKQGKAERKHFIKE